MIYIWYDIISYIFPYYTFSCSVTLNSLCHLKLVRLHFSTSRSRGKEVFPKHEDQHLSVFNPMHYEFLKNKVYFRFLAAFILYSVFHCLQIVFLFFFQYFLFSFVIIFCRRRHSKSSYRHFQNFYPILVLLIFSFFF